MGRLVAPPSRRLVIRQGERSPFGPTYQQASVQPPGRDARATNGSETTGQRAYAILLENRATFL
ncbi:MAG TPA: hypothetical protein VH599_16335 [Ktedonobacterales bacterium]